MTWRATIQACVVLVASVVAGFVSGMLVPSLPVATTDLTPTWIVAACTVATLIVVVIQAVLMARTNQHTRAIERGYVTMSHKPPGLSIEFFSRVSLTVRVKNFGQTPAHITDVFQKALLVKRGDTLDAAPNYTTRFPRVKPDRAFLVAGDDFAVSASLPLEGVDDHFSVGIGGTHDVYILGYVDYVDSFGGRRRSGYARLYNATVDNADRYLKPNSAAIPREIDRVDWDRFARRNNMHFVTEPGYNYDRPRTAQEGNDWNESIQI